MDFFHVTESIILVITAVLCTLLLLKILYNLRSMLSWRVNCWFCNKDFWIKFIDRNSWTCPSCDQYNGFKKDGDYNKTLTLSNNRSSKSPKLFQRTPPKNGLCKMCNINQQLKITQLANFVPMNEKKYDEEIETYRAQLEKAYKLCSPCRKVLQTKLHKEKETLLDSKLLESRSPEKNTLRNQRQNEVLVNLINTISKIAATVLIVLIVIDCYRSFSKHKNLIHTVHNIFSICQNFLERIFTIAKMEILLYFPSLNNAIDNEMFKYYENIIPNFKFSFEINDIAQKVLAGFACFIQIVGHFWNINKTKNSIIIEMMWAVFMIISISSKHFTRNTLIMDLIKLSIVCTILLTYRSLKVKAGKSITRKHITPKKMTKQFVNNLTKTNSDEEDNISLDTDDDVSLSKFGLHNLTSSSNETITSLKKNLTSGRSFTPRKDSLWNKPKLNSTFCVNSMLSNNSSNLTEPVLIKPSFNKYQTCKDDSDSDLDESISSLCISSPKKRSSTVNPVFALRKFTASPNFIAPSPMNRSRPLISPSKLGHGTSWVAGGYWGSDSERQTFNVNGSRSSSQSSGFESQGSSMNQRNVFSQPPSREESVCGELERNPIMLDRFQNLNMTSYNFQSPSSFAPINSPVFPQMHYNSHVQIPQPRFPQQNFVSQNVFAQQYIPNSTFKAPVGPTLIKLPQDSFQCSSASQYK